MNMEQKFVLQAHKHLTIQSKILTRLYCDGYRSISMCNFRPQLILKFFISRAHARNSNNLAFFKN